MERGKYYKKGQGALSLWFVEIISLACISLFVYAGLAKILEYEKTVLQLARNPLLKDYADIIAWAVPGLELLIAGMIGWRKSRRIGLYAFLVLMGAFTGYIIHTLHFSKSTPCSCGGVLDHLSWNQHLVFNIVFMTLATVGLILQDKLAQNKEGGALTSKISYKD